MRAEFLGMTGLWKEGSFLVVRPALDFWDGKE